MAKSFFKQRSPAGFTLVEILIALALTGVVLAGIASAILSLLQEQKRAALTTTLSELRLTFQQPVIKTSDWDFTKAHNAGMSCFAGSAPTTCVSEGTSAPADFAIYNAGTTTPIYDSANPTAGYTVEGSPCSTYGSSGCVLKPHLTWKAQCNLAVDPTCLGPLIRINLSFLYSGPPLGSVNLASYGFQIDVATFPVKSVEACPGAPPGCTASQAAICNAGAWSCEEFGL